MDITDINNFYYYVNFFYYCENAIYVVQMNPSWMMSLKYKGISIKCDTDSHFTENNVLNYYDTMVMIEFISSYKKYIRLIEINNNIICIYPSSYALEFYLNGEDVILHVSKDCAVKHVSELETELNNTIFPAEIKNIIKSYDKSTLYDFLEMKIKTALNIFFDIIINGRLFKQYTKIPRKYRRIRRSLLRIYDNAAQ